MMSGDYWTKWVWKDWDSDIALKGCSLAAQGLWMRMLCIASQHDPIGFVSINRNGLNHEGIALIVGRPVDEVRTLIGELAGKGVFSRDRNGAIYNRRMVRDAQKAAIARKNGALGGNPILCKQEEKRQPDNPMLNATNKPTVIRQEARNQESRKKETHASVLNPSEFQQFWDCYGHKVDRPRAEKALVKALRKATLERILNGARSYRAGLSDLKYIKDPAAWLNGERWNDEPALMNGCKINSENLTSAKLIFIEEGTPQWNAWDKSWRKTKSTGPPVMCHKETHKRGWHFLTEWPPSDP